MVLMESVEMEALTGMKASTTEMKMAGVVEGFPPRRKRRCCSRVHLVWWTSTADWR